MVINKYGSWSFSNLSRGLGNRRWKYEKMSLPNKNESYVVHNKADVAIDYNFGYVVVM